MANIDDEDKEFEITLPSFRNWSDTKIYDYDSQIVDYDSITELDQAIQKARRALFILTSKINSCERQERLSKIEYERTFRRYYLESTEKTEAAKKARADIKCEDLENKWIVYQQLKEELIRMSMTVRQELQTLQTIGNNLRLQLRTSGIQY